MAKDKCIVRLEDLLKKSKIDSVQADEVIDEIKKTVANEKIETIDNELKEKISDDILKRQEFQKKIDKRNALEDEIKVRNLAEYVINNFADDPVEGLQAILVGSNEQKTGSRLSAALSQFTEYRQLVSAFNEKLRQKKLIELFANADESIDRKVARTIWELDLEKPITEKNKDIIELAKVMHEFSDNVRKKYNDNGANIGKLPGWIVRQSHDPFSIRNAAEVLGGKYVDSVKDINGSLEKNLKAWKDYILPKLDPKTFADMEAGQTKDEFLNFVFNSLVKNEAIVADGVSNTYGSRNLAKKAGAKRILHFKDADAWFDYNSKFGTGNLRESFFAGLNNAGRNLGLIKTLGTNPTANFDKIKNIIKRRNIDKPSVNEKITNANQKFVNQLKELDGSVNMIGHFDGAKWSAITRSIASMAKLGGATISAMADVHLYATELRYQGRSYLGGVFEAMGNLAKIKNTAKKQAIAEQLGFMADNVIYDLAARYSTGDNLNKQFTKIQRTFFKLNLLQWWTNSLKEGAMLGMANYVAKNRKLKFSNLDDGFKRLLNHYDIDENLWNIIRKLDVEKAEDGAEFFSVRNIDSLSNDTLKSLMSVDKATERQINNFRDLLKSKVSGMFLDRSTYAVIEPDARVRATMKQGTMAGTAYGEALRFFFQFKGFPLAIWNKSIKRELSHFGAGNTSAGVWGVASLIVGSGIFGYVAMTAKDLLKGRSPKDPTKYKTFLAAMLQGGGAGIYGDFLFSQTRTPGDIALQVLGPVPSEGFQAMQAIKYGIQGQKDPALRQAYRSVVGNIPFLNLFYLKTAFDYAIGYQIMETLSPGHLRRMESRMERDTGQEFLLTKPSRLFKGF
jgi:hypothetical protein